MTVSTVPSAFPIRKATHDDAAAIANLGGSVFSATFGHTVTPQQLKSYLDEAYTAEAIEKDIADPLKDTVIAVTEDGGHVIGFAMLTRGSTEPCVEHAPNRIELQRLYVDSKYHGNGLGKLLARAVEDIAREQGFRHMWLGAWEENHKAQRLYQKLGYKLVGEHSFDVGGDIQTDQILLKEL